MNISELKKRYKSINKIKKGGQKIVYKAIRDNDTPVALKIISNVSDKRVLQEIDILKSLDICNTPKIIESGIVNDEAINEDSLYIIEEFINGISLRDWIDSGKQADINFLFRLLETLISIEIILEEKKILHRDINPNNIMLDNNGTFYLIDFGIAKKLDGTSFTQTAAINGPYTPGYAPHEQVANLKLEQDSRTDLFQIGVTIYETCTGKNPFIEKDDTLFEVVTKTIEFNPPLLSINGDSKGMFSQYINMLMAKNQSQRPDSAKDAIRYLNAVKSTLELGE